MPKDWTGNSKAVFSTLAASNHSETDRVDNDYYATPPDAVKELLKREKFNTYIWECAVGGGHIADVLKEYGYKVKSSDIIDRGYSDTEIANFLLTERDKNDFSRDIITNPPYNRAQEFIQHALELIPSGRRVFMFLKIQFLEGKKRRELFDSGCLKTVYVSSSRILCAKNGDFENARKIGGSAVSYAWYEFEKGYKGGTTIKWIN